MSDVREVVCINWIEHVRGFDYRPDGHTLHISMANARDLIKREMNSRVDKVPDYYSEPRTPFIVNVDEETFDKIKNNETGCIWGTVRKIVNERYNDYGKRTAKKAE